MPNLAAHIGGSSDRKRLMPASNPMGIQGSPASQMEGIRSRPVLVKKKAKLKDKVIPQKVRELVPESQSYMDLLEFERKLDNTIMRKRLDIQEALKRFLSIHF